MTPEELKQMEDAMKANLATFPATLASDADFQKQMAAAVQRMISEQESDKYNKLEADYRDVKAELAKLQQRGDEDPSAQKVKDLEKRLDDADAKRGELEEKLRLMRAHPTLPPADGTERKLDWGGRIIRDVEKLKEALRQRMLEGESRALDSSLFAGGGKLSAETSNLFIDFVISQQVALQRITVLRLNSPQGHTDELRVAARKMRAATEGTAPASLADGVSTKRRTLNTVEVIWPEDITLTLLEDAIERAGTEQHIAKLLALAFGNDAEDLGWNGDTTTYDSVGADPFLSINNGWIALAKADGDVSDLDATSQTKVSGLLNAMLRKMPVKFLGRIDNSFWVPVATGMVYADEVSTRATNLGDSVLVDGFPKLRYFGAPVYPVSYLQGDEALFNPTPNLHFGIQRVMTIDAEWAPRKRAVEYTITARADYEYASGQAIVLADNIPAALRS